MGAAYRAVFRGRTLRFLNTPHFSSIILTTASFPELLYGCFEVLFHTQILPDPILPQPPPNHAT
jgi:hypothetical protein